GIDELISSGFTSLKKLLSLKSIGWTPFYISILAGLPDKVLIKIFSVWKIFLLYQRLSHFFYLKKKMLLFLYSINIKINLLREFKSLLKPTFLLLNFCFL